jgi:hypothetical protein
MGTGRASVMYIINTQRSPITSFPPWWWRQRGSLKHWTFAPNWRGRSPEKILSRLIWCWQKMIFKFLNMITFFKFLNMITFFKFLNMITFLYRPTSLFHALNINATYAYILIFHPFWGVIYWNLSFLQSMYTLQFVSVSLCFSLQHVVYPFVSVIGYFLFILKTCLHISCNFSMSVTLLSYRISNS